MNENIIVLGATSGIAEAVVERWAARKCRLVLTGRKLEEVERIAADLRVRYGAEVHAKTFEATAFDGHADLYEDCKRALGGEVNGVLLSHGYMAEQADAQQDFAIAQRTIDVNLTSAISFLEIVARDFEAKGAGWIVGISSVAGDRGRQSNYIYGASKAGLSAYLQGLRNRLAKKLVHVMTVKPGFVYTALTEAMLDPKSPLVAQPEKVAKDIDKAIARRKDVLYTPWFWWGIMSIIRSIPERIFKKLSL